MLVGYTGFVGSNLAAAHDFDQLINSKNIETAFGKAPKRLIYAGVPAEMFLANKFPEKDEALIRSAIDNIRKIDAETVVLISTVAVYDCTDGVDEDHEPDPTVLTAYGRNRLMLEQWVETHCPRHLIVRLPAIFGANLKKNFLYDYIHVIPAMLKADKYAELAAKDELIREHYIDMENGFFKCLTEDKAIRKALKSSFEKVGFSALNFTDSRSVYQFFDLSYLYDAIENCLAKGIRKINLVTPPVSTAEVFEHLSGRSFENHLDKPPFAYDLRTKYTATGYVMTKEQELGNIAAFVHRALSEE